MVQTEGQMTDTDAAKDAPPRMTPAEKRAWNLQAAIEEALQDMGGEGTGATARHIMDVLGLADLVEALREIRLLASIIPVLRRNPRFQEANRAALAAVAKATGAAQ